MQKILVVEDEVALSKFYRFKLEQAGFAVKIVLNGKEAIDALHEFFPDLIILDLILPVQDGFVTLKKLKANKKWEHIPTLVATNLGQKQDIDVVMKLGASDYMVKTETTSQDIVTKVTQILKKSSTVQNIS